MLPGSKLPAATHFHDSSWQGWGALPTGRCPGASGLALSDPRPPQPEGRGARDPRSESGQQRAVPPGQPAGAASPPSSPERPLERGGSCRNIHTVTDASDPLISLWRQPAGAHPLHAAVSALSRPQRRPCVHPLSTARRLSPRKRISQSSGHAAPAMPGNGSIRCCVTGHLEAHARLHPAPVMSQTGSDLPSKD